MKFIQEAQKDAFDPKTTIIRRLLSDVGGYRPARSHEKVHASDVTKEDFCPRQTALLDLTGAKKKDEYIETAMEVTFHVGEATAGLFVERWGKKWVYGDWECVRCGQQRTFCLQPVLSNCKAKPGNPCRWQYREMGFVSTETGVSGSLDAVVDLGAPKLFVTELKIMAPDQFEKLTCPLPEHRIRTSLYLKLIDESNSMYKDRLNVTEGRVLYVSRAWGKLHPEYKQIIPFKEYVVKRDDASVAPYLEKAYAVKLWREKKMMPAGVCHTSADKKAKKCAVCPACFSGKYPVTQ